MSHQKGQQNRPHSANRWRWSGVGCLAILVGVPLIYYGSYFAMRQKPTTPPQVIAHRGGRAYAPENTLKAFRNAITRGADWLEMDVQRTRDGALVVIHDSTVDRTTNGTGSVKDLTLEQVRLLDAGNGEKIPTFDEVIQLAKESGVALLPEAKESQLYPGLGPEMVQAVRNAGYVQNTVIQSFDKQTLSEILDEDPQIKVAPLSGLWELSLRNPQPYEARWVCPMAEMVLLNPWMIKQAHDQGQKVFVWFGIIEHPLIMRLILALGVDGLIVDDPVVLAKIVGR